MNKQDEKWLFVVISNKQTYIFTLKALTDFLEKLSEDASEWAAYPLEIRIARADLIP